MIEISRADFRSGPPGHPVRPPAARALCRARLQRHIHELLAGEFQRQKAAGRLTQAEVARRMGKHPPYISRLLGSPRNMRTSTVADLAFAIGDAELRIVLVPAAAEHAADESASPAGSIASDGPAMTA